MSKKQYDFIDFNENEQKVYNFQKQNKIEKVNKVFYDLSKKWDDKCFEHDCIYGKDHQGIKALSVKLSNFNVRENVKHLSIYSTKEVILDKDLTLNSGHFTVVAPIIKIPDRININLSGNDGLGYAGKANNGQWESNCIDISLLGFIYASSNGGTISCNYNTNRKGGTDGLDGLPGTSGKNGGNLTLIAQKYEGIDNLGINVSGGSGGNGQGGGDGGSCNTSYITAPIKRAGGNGGNGGDGGIGGKSGSINIYQQKQDISNSKYLSKYNIKAKEGTNGVPGEGGEGGIGWQGCIYTSGVEGHKGTYGILPIHTSSVIQNKDLLPEIKHDYVNFLENYIGKDFGNSIEYADLVGKDTDFDSFL